jgi:enterochelin esterase-like enzyme
MRAFLIAGAVVLAGGCAGLPADRAAPVTQAEAPLQVPSSGRIERLADFPSRHVPARHVEVWLPEGYPAQAPYAVLYMHDGQMLFDAAHTWNRQEWQVDEVAARLQAQGAARPFIVVGVWNGGARRHTEYFPQRPFGLLAADRQAALHAAEREPGKPLFAAPVASDAYLKFLVTELKPAIDARYAVSPRREDTFVAGSSMGGLISMYALLEYPEVFGGAACLSTHWPGAFDPDDPAIPDAFLAYLGERLPAPGRHRLWFDHGTETIDAWYGKTQVRVDALLAARGWREPWWSSRVYPGTDHSERAWAARLDEPLQFLLSP